MAILPSTAFRVRAILVASLAALLFGKSISGSQEPVTQNVQRFSFDSATGSISGTGTWVTTGTRRWLDAQPSPDDKFLALGEDSYEGALYLSRADGTQLRRLTTDPAWYRWPRWSHDGHELAVTITRLGRKTPVEVRLLTPDGVHSQRVTTPPGAISYPFWEPGGARLAVTDPALGMTTFISVHSRKPDASTLYFDQDSGQTFVAQSSSPNGEWLAGVMDSIDPKGVAVYSVQRYKLVRLTDAGCCAIWLSDSQRLIFKEGHSLMLMDLRDRRKHEIFSSGPDEIVSYALSHDDRTMFLIVRHVERSQGR